MPHFHATKHSSLKYSSQNKSDSADTTESNFGTSVSGDGVLRSESFSGSQNASKPNNLELSPAFDTSKSMRSSNSDTQFDLYRNNPLDTTSQSPHVRWQPQTSSVSRVPSLGDAAGISMPQVSNTQVLSGLDSSNQYAGYAWASATNSSSATNNYNTAAASRDLWSSTAATASAGKLTANTSASSSHLPKMQGNYYSGSDSLFNPLYDTSNGNIPLAASTSMANSDMDALAMQLMQLNLPNPSSSLQSLQTHKGPAYSSSNDFYMSWPTYSNQSANSASKAPAGNQSSGYMNMQSQIQLDQRGSQIQKPGTPESVAEIEDHKIQLELKDSMIKKLEEEVARLNTILRVSDSDDNKRTFEIPKNHEQLYTKLTEKLQAAQEELEETKLRLEVILTAVALNPNQSVTKTGRYDEEEIAHKVITKMQMLTEENEEMAKMLSYGKSKEKDIEIGLLRKQNVELKSKVAKLEVKLKELKK
ncbi:hypothetical protein KL930_002364 [Ogataea haglerorum]|uniref:Protein MUM2 n=1 Tax=Ogataea haglerorum TaxID=1937702 RepID=A0ABQ7RM77_9ASCO|nr:uncharacterized protein KL911_000030 [Ogataea haglerorum]KAG7698849.1 hypothetical protein KL915_001141 [Ogataea haglerorum]KAG7709891.1 hypothetical protein KL914_000801 [Ogataea haglerorum]KAG7711329.1 hypothetical protein KL950_001295 [Ogataea haglerorum]KAG7758893.1 hypothetical protein KL911_000030 [Ogataea haglerorum]KAG7760148.1 hypothetical protein KL947_001778 [Ogataea haglerorum]